MRLSALGGMLSVAATLSSRLPCAQTVDGTQLMGIATRHQLQAKLKAHPKILILLAALGRQLSVDMVRNAINDVLNNERMWM